jgi:hypothetical protein
MKVLMFGVCNANHDDIWDTGEFKKQIGKEILYYNKEKGEMKVMGRLSGISYVKRRFNGRGEEIDRKYLPSNRIFDEIKDASEDIRPYLEFDNGARSIPKTNLEIYYAR